MKILNYEDLCIVCWEIGLQTSQPCLELCQLFDCFIPWLSTAKAAVPIMWLKMCNSLCRLRTIK